MAAKKAVPKKTVVRPVVKKALPKKAAPAKSAPKKAALVKANGKKVVKVRAPRIFTGVTKFLREYIVEKGLDSPKTAVPAMAELVTKKFPDANPSKSFLYWMRHEARRMIELQSKAAKGKKGSSART